MTFLFTDVESSTRLLEELGADGYAAVNEEHRQAVREALARHGGVEVSTHGDAFFAAFTDPVAAVQAAEAAQQLLAGGRLKVRMGLHHGAAVIADDTYVGMDVNRAARIADAAHGGQIVLSPVVRASLDDSFVLTDLGEQRLKDLGEPIRLFQLGTAAFPPLRVLGRSNLPVPTTPFVGRERDLAAVVALLRRDDARLVNLTGPGGTGKTRLALQAAAEVAEGYPDGVHWVPLAPLHDPALVLPTVADVVCGQRAAGGTPLERLAGRVASRALLLLDNAEHLLPDVAAHVSEMLHAVPTLTLVVTSRERLRVAGELTFPVPTLDVGDGVALFVQRATALDPSFTRTRDVDELCARLDHLPLALELAAARTSLLTPRQLLDRLGERLDLLKGGRDADPRQQTLRATIAWSHALLEPGEQDAFARMSVFAGGCTVEAAEEVCETDLDTIQSLLDKSLLRRRETDEGPRLWMLETIREFAAERLEDAQDDGAAQAARLCHLELYTRLAREAWEPWLTERGSYDPGRLEVERDNLRAALGTAADRAPEEALELAGMLGMFWIRSGAFDEGRRRLAEALHAAPDAPATLRGRAQALAGSLALKQGDLDHAERLAGEVVAIARSIDDRRLAGEALNTLGIAAWYRGRFDDATMLLSEAADAYRSAGSRRGEHTTLGNLAGVANARGDHHEAIRLFRDLVATEREVDGEPNANTLNNLGLALEAVGETDEARQTFEQAVALARLRSLETMPYALASLAHVLVGTDRAEARRHYDESLGLFREAADVRGIAYCLDGLATLALDEGDAERSATLLGSADAVRARTGVRLDGTEQQELDATIAWVRERLGDEPFAAAWSEGARLDLDHVVALALAPTVERTARG